MYPYKDKFTLSSNLKAILKEKGMSLRELERRSGEDYEAIRRIYNNLSKQVNLSLVANICLTLDIRIDELYTIAKK